MATVEYILSDYRCPGCGRPAQRIHCERVHVGVIHKSGCWFYNQLNALFPRLVHAINEERKVAA
jgi:hypothetical protein